MKATSVAAEFGWGCTGAMVPAGSVLTGVEDGVDEGVDCDNLCHKRSSTMLVCGKVRFNKSKE